MVQYGKILCIFLFLAILTFASGCGGPKAQDAIDLHQELLPKFSELAQLTIIIEWTPSDSLENRMKIAKAEQEFEKLYPKIETMAEELQEIIDELSGKELEKWERYMANR